MSCQLFSLHALHVLSASVTYCCAIFYISPELQEQVQPVEFGWTNVAGYNDYGARDMALRADAGRYECGTLNTIGCFGLRASMEFLLEVGTEIGRAHV